VVRSNILINKYELENLFKNKTFSLSNPFSEPLSKAFSDILLPIQTLKCDVAKIGGGAMSGGRPPHHLRPDQRRSFVSFSVRFCVPFLFVFPAFIFFLDSIWVVLPLFLLSASFFPFLLVVLCYEHGCSFLLVVLCSEHGFVLCGSGSRSVDLVFFFC
jgi:hypothetical protein